MDKRILKEWRNEGKSKDRIIKIYREEIENIAKLTANYEGEKMNSSKKVYDAEAERLVKLMDEKDKKIEEIIAERKEKTEILLKTLNKLEKPEHVIILTDKYMLGDREKSLEELAEELQYSLSYIRKIHREALAEFEKIQRGE